MDNQKSFVVSSKPEVINALEKIGLSPQLVQIIAESAAAARAEALAIDPYGTAGTLSYIYGIRAMRLHLLPKGWREDRTCNVESVINDSLGVRLCFQNVDLACNPAHDPRAISAKGSGSRQLVAEGQGELFDLEHANAPDKLGCKPTVWVICTCADENSIRTEVSCPVSFEGNQFGKFYPRIFVLNETFDTEPNKSKIGSYESDDFDVHISKK